MNGDQKRKLWKLKKEAADKKVKPKKEEKK